ncbi:MAG: hypothetical protein LBK26_02035, partial [Rickettsiales bacterium]|jgi:histidyl-tRNA synthetase|nr:hypothetical protein [Rickettsiales bacterium]
VPLLESGAIDLSRFENAIDAAVLVMGRDQVPFAMSVCARLRDAGIVVVPYLDADKKFKNQMEFADKIMTRFSIIIGEDEVESEKLTVKNMKTGDQQSLSVSCLIDMLKTTCRESI